MNSRLYLGAILTILFTCSLLRGQAGSSITPSKLIHKVDPEYTEEGCKAKREGTVIFQVTIKKDGSVEVVKEMSKTLGLGLDKNAEEAIKQWRFQTGQKDGESVDVSGSVEVTFKLLSHSCDRWSKH